MSTCMLLSSHYFPMNSYLIGYWTLNIYKYGVGVCANVCVVECCCFVM